jgi:hypothetical protein
MSETYIDRAPTEEELSEQLLGVTFSDFQLMTDDKRTEFRDTVHAAMSTESDDDIGQAWGYAHTFRNFVTWRKFGIPDRDMSWEELQVRVTDTVFPRSSTGTPKPPP